MRHVTGIALCVFVAACGGDTSSDDSGSGSQDETPPLLRSVFAELSGGLMATVDLSSSSQLRILPFEHMIEFSILVTDETTSSDELEITISGGDGQACENQSAIYSSGLWRAECMISPGQSLSVQVADASGNISQSNLLSIPSYLNAISGGYSIPQYGVNGQLEGNHSAVYSSDGNWQEQQHTTGQEYAGTFEVDGSILIWRQTISPEDSDSQTIEEASRVNFYVDADYFSLSPLQRLGEGAGVLGVWQSSLQPLGTSLAGDELGLPIVRTLSLVEQQTSVDGWQGTWTETVEQGSVMILSHSGEYRVVPNENYTENFGDFLHRRVIGGPDDTQEIYELFVLRFGQLLLSPHIRQ